MNKKIKIIKWKEEELDRMKNFISLNSESFLTHFYQNLLNPVTQTRREPRIFIRMMKYIGKTTKQCKSKFQKYEKTIFKDFLKIPKDHIMVYDKLKTNKRKKKKISALTKNNSALLGNCLIF